MTACLHIYSSKPMSAQTGHGKLWCGEKSGEVKGDVISFISYFCKCLPEADYFVSVHVAETLVARKSNL